VPTVRKSHSRMLAACAHKNSAQLVSRRFGAGSIPASRGIVETVLRSELDAESDQLTLDPPVPPTRILAREPHDELTDLLRRRRPTRAPMRIRPTARDQLTMPAQECSGRNQERSFPRRPGQHTAERRQKRSIRRRQLRTCHLPLKHLQLVTEQQNLDLLLPLRTTPDDEQLEQPPRRRVREGTEPDPENEPPPAPTLPVKGEPHPTTRLTRQLSFRHPQAAGRAGGGPTGLSRRRSRVRAPSLPPLEVPAKRHLLLSRQVKVADPQREVCCPTAFL
jgi:hypothetical protein